MAVISEQLRGWGGEDLVQDQLDAFSERLKEAGWQTVGTLVPDSYAHMAFFRADRSNFMSEDAMAGIVEAEVERDPELEKKLKVESISRNPKAGVPYIVPGSELPFIFYSGYDDASFRAFADRLAAAADQTEQSTEKTTMPISFGDEPSVRYAVHLYLHGRDKPDWALDLEVAGIWGFSHDWTALDAYGLSQQFPDAKGWVVPNETREAFEERVYGRILTADELERGLAKQMDWEREMMGYTDEEWEEKLPSMFEGERRLIAERREREAVALQPSE